MTWKQKMIEKISRRVPELEENEDLLLDLLDEAFVAIIDYTQANAYERSWDRALVECVVRIYNYMGVEGSTSRSNGDVNNTYDSRDIIAPILGGLRQKIRPSGYSYSPTRYDYPKE